MSKVEALPKGWVVASIGDLAEYINGFAFKPAHRSENGKPIIRIQNLTNKAKPFNRTEIDVPAIYEVKHGDLLVSWSATLDAFLWWGENAWLNQHIFKVNTEKELFHSGLLYYWMKIAIREMANTEHLHGSTMKHINRGPFLAHATKVPPFNEQNRLFDKLEELLSDLDNGVKELEAAQIKLTHYRQSLLKSAVEGGLTKTWRQKNSDKNTETGAQLLVRVLKGRRENWLQNKLAEFKEKDKKPSKNWQDKYPEPVEPGSTGLVKLPTGWCWASAMQVAADEKYSLAIGPFGSNLKVIDYREAGVPLVFVRNIRSGDYGGSFTKYISEEKAAELLAHCVMAGDVVVTKMGEPPGDADVLPNSQPKSVITADCIKIRCNKDLILADFVKISINSSVGKKQIIPMTKGVAQKKVSLGRFASLAIPVPPIEEQRVIVVQYQQKLEMIDNKEQSILLGLKQAAAQRKNILKDAFLGKLVPQDPTDEPASILLEKIKAQRAELAKQPKPKRTQKKSTAMKKIEAKAIASWIEKLDKDEFTFVELQTHFNGSYEELKDGLFSLLSQKNASVKQTFDETAGCMHFTKATA